MNTKELSNLTADPIQVLGMSFYFDPLTKEKGREHGINVVEFYGLGRAGVLGDVDTSVVVEAFTFFDPSSIDYFWTSAKEKADPVVVAAAHVEAAYAFADRTFGAIDPTVLANFAAAARKAAEAEPRGVCPLLDGYLQYPTPSDPVHAAYLGTILLRELRGGVHIHAVSNAGLDPVEACYLQDPLVFTLHGYKEDATPEVTKELEAKKRRAEELTGEAVASCFDVLSDEEREALAVGTKLMFDALQNPVPVAR
jgi:helix-turn-helix protein